MRPDEILLLDMLLAAREAIEFVSACPLEQFEKDRIRQLAVIKSIEIIGEAASRVSESFRETHRELPWREIIGMRHRLVHGYFEIDYNRVWETANNELPKLLTVLEKLVPAEGD